MPRETWNRGGLQWVLYAAEGLLITDKFKQVVPNQQSSFRCHLFDFFSVQMIQNAGNRAKTGAEDVWYDGLLDTRSGAVAQLGARLDGIEEAVGSNPIGSTNSYE